METKLTGKQGAEVTEGRGGQKRWREERKVLME
jgi:hypothetical protein